MDGQIASIDSATLASAAAKIDTTTSPETSDAPNANVTVTINVKMPIELHTELKTQAASQRLTLKEYALHLLEEALAVKAQK